MTAGSGMQLEVSRRIAASPERLFAAWTTPSQLLSWWGPKGVRCTHADLDLVVGSRYRLRNELPDGGVTVIVGEFLVIEPPTRLVYTWSFEGGTEDPERVTVTFNAVSSAIGNAEIGRASCRERV